MKVVTETAFRIVGHARPDFADLVVWRSPFGDVLAAMRAFDDRGVCLGSMSAFPSTAYFSEPETDAAMGLLSDLPDELPILKWASALDTLGHIRALHAHWRADSRATARARAMAMLSDALKEGARVGYSALGVHVECDIIRFVEQEGRALRPARENAHRFGAQFGNLLRTGADFVEPFEWLN